MGRLIGYARVSTSDQDICLQLDALRDAGCLDEQVFLDTASGARNVRPGLDACLQALGPGDTLVVWRLDRLGRSMAHLVTLVEDLLQRQVGFRSLGDGVIDTTNLPLWRRRDKPWNLLISQAISFCDQGFFSVYTRLARWKYMG